VQEATGNLVSNPYLSQLERGLIAKPSPKILAALAKVYNCSYDDLMRLAGFAALNPESLPEGLSIHGLSADEHDSLLDYLCFIRGKRKKPLP
jgi:transcriptional regulator with XRE-family HTH domain